MGDRGNVVVINRKYGSDDYEGVWLYSHWGGHRLHESTAKAVASCGRVGDPEYLTRIIFCNLIADGMTNGELRGLECLDKEAETATPEEQAKMYRDMVEEFLSETSFGIGPAGHEDQEYPTVVVNADTGEVWLDENHPCSIEEISIPEGKESPQRGGLMTVSI